MNKFLARQKVILTEIKKLIWQTDTDFAKGVHTDTEVDGVDKAAKLQLEDETDLDSNVGYETAGNYTPSDGAKIEVLGGNARLKATGGESSDWPFDTPSNYSYPSSDILVNGGQATLKTQESNNSFAATYKYIIDGIYGDGDISGTATGGAAISSSELDLKHNDLRYVSYDATDNADSLQTGCIRFLVRPNYSGTPSTIQVFTSIFETSGSLNNLVQIQQQSSGGWLRVVICDPTGSVIVAYSTVAWNPTAGIQYEIELNWDLTTGATRVFLDGVQQGTTQTATGTRDEAKILRVGTNYLATTTSNFTISDLVIFDSVQHTANYTPSSFTPFVTTEPDIIPSTGLAFTSALTIFTETATKYGNDDIQYQVSVDDGVTWKYWTGAAWATITGGQTDTWYYTNESNTASVVNSKISSLGSSGTFKFRAFLHSFDGTDTPRLLHILVSSPLTYPTTDNLYIDTKDAGQVDTSGILNFLTTTITNSLPANTDIKLLLSNDGRSTWLGWNGSAWATVTGSTLRSNATSITDIVAQIASFPVGTNDTLDIRLFLYTLDSSARPTVSNINVTADKGYKTSGDWEATVINSTIYSLDWGAVNFSVETPSGSTVVVQVRAGNVADLSSEAYSSALANHEESEVTGQYFQVRVSFTGTKAVRSSLSLVAITYETPDVQEVLP